MIKKVLFLVAILFLSFSQVYASEYKYIPELETFSLRTLKKILNSKGRLIINGNNDIYILEFNGKGKYFKDIDITYDFKLNIPNEKIIIPGKANILFVNNKLYIKISGVKDFKYNSDWVLIDDIKDIFSFIDENIDINDFYQFISIDEIRDTGSFIFKYNADKTKKSNTILSNLFINGRYKTDLYGDLKTCNIFLRLLDYNGYSISLTSNLVLYDTGMDIFFYEPVTNFLINFY